MSFPDSQTHELELEYVRLSGSLSQAKTQMAICNLQLAEIVTRYARHAKMSKEEAALILVRLNKMAKNVPF